MEMQETHVGRLLTKKDPTAGELRLLVASFRLAYNAMEKLGSRYHIAAEALFRDLCAAEARLENLSVEWPFDDE